MQMISKGFPIGSIFGIKIAVDFSWIFIFLLVTWNLVLGVFPRLHPEWGALLTWTVGITASLLFFASVLAHELAHSLVARARGLPVNRITLFLFGGVSNLEKEPPSAKTEFLMAVVGPLTSIGLGIFFLFLGNIFSGRIMDIATDPDVFLSQIGPVATLLLWLGPINILVGIFNLLPGFPLDGGRILRSVIWTITGSFSQATRYAAFMGQLTGWFFIGIGILMIFGISIPIFGSGLGGLWLVFIGWFLNSLAGQSFQQVVAEDRLKGIEVGALMRSDFSTINENIPVKDLIYKYFLKSNERAYPVMREGRLAGLVSLDDVRDLDQENIQEKRVKDIMTPAHDLEIVNPKEGLAGAVEKISRKDVAQLPVIKDKKLVGMLDRRDIVLWLQLNSSKASV